MKAIRTYYLPCSTTKPRRMVATTGERGQRVVKSLDDMGSLWPEQEHAVIARVLANKFNWSGQLLGGGFPDGSMVWVFADTGSFA